MMQKTFLYTMLDFPHVWKGAKTRRRQRAGVVTDPEEVPELCVLIHSFYRRKKQKLNSWAFFSPMGGESSAK